MTTVKLTEGETAPSINLETDGAGRFNLSEDQSAAVVLYFYPKDDTPGCTKEAIAFTDLMPEFSSLNVAVVGVSPDTPAKHDKFKAKHQLSVVLASDPSTELCHSYGVWVEKNMYGKKYMGVERSTFLIGADGEIKRIWRKVKVPGHAEAVLEATKELLA